MAGRGPVIPDPGPQVRIALAVLLVVVSAVVIATSGESVAVRLLLAVVSLDVAVRLARGGG